MCLQAGYLKTSGEVSSWHRSEQYFIFKMMLIALQLEVKKAFFTAQKMKDFFSKCDQIRSLPRIWSHLLKKS